VVWVLPVHYAYECSAARLWHLQPLDAAVPFAAGVVPAQASHETGFVMLRERHGERERAESACVSRLRGVSEVIKAAQYGLPEGKTKHEYGLAADPDASLPKDAPVSNSDGGVGRGRQHDVREIRKQQGKNTFTFYYGVWVGTFVP
jgi:hypothetical protein